MARAQSLVVRGRQVVLLGRKLTLTWTLFLLLADPSPDSLLPLTLIQPQSLLPSLRTDTHFYQPPPSPSLPHPPPIPLPSPSLSPLPSPPSSISHSNCPLRAAPHTPPSSVPHRWPRPPPNVHRQPPSSRPECFSGEEATWASVRNARSRCLTLQYKN